MRARETGARTEGRQGVGAPHSTGEGESRVHFDYGTVEALVRPRTPEIPEITIPEPDLSSYDALLGGAA